MLILAGVAINLTVGQNGIIKKAHLAVKNHINATNNEKTQIDEMYSQILVATNDDAIISIKVKELKELINETVDAKLQSYGNTYIDATNKIADIQLNTEYVASEDCIVSGTAGTYGVGGNPGLIEVYIDSVFIRIIYE